MAGYYTDEDAEVNGGDSPVTPVFHKLPQRRNK